MTAFYKAPAESCCKSKIVQQFLIANLLVKPNFRKIINFNFNLFPAAGGVVSVVVAVGVGLAEVVVDLTPQIAGAGIIEDVAEAGHVAPGVDDVVESVPVLVGVVTASEVVDNVAGGVPPTLSHQTRPLQLGRDRGSQTVDVLLVLVEVDPADAREVVPPDVFPDTEAV